MTEAYDGRQVVGIDLHRQRSVIVRMTEDGRKLETVRITNSPAALRRVIAKAGERQRGRRCTWRIRWACGPTAAGGSRTISATPRTWPTCCGWAGCRRRGSRRRRSASCGS